MLCAGYQLMAYSGSVLLASGPENGDDYCAPPTSPPKKPLANILIFK